MLQKTDLILLLTEMSEKGDATADKYITEVVTSPTISLNALKYINDNRQLSVSNFYDGIRKNYNKKKSNLYKNIVRDIDDPEEVLSTLHAFVLQVFLYSKKLEDKERLLFYKHARAEEVTSVLNKFYTDYDINSAFKLLKLIKADLKTFEYIK